MACKSFTAANPGALISIVIITPAAANPMPVAIGSDRRAKYHLTSAAANPMPVAIGSDRRAKYHLTSGTFVYMHIVIYLCGRANGIFV
jgi:hypothetical protein